MGLFDNIQQGGGLFGNISQKVMPFAQNNNMALLGAGMGLLSGNGWGAGAQGFMQGAQADQGRHSNRLQQQLLMQEAQRKQQLFDQSQQDRKLQQQQMNATEQFIAKNMPELVGAPREVQIAAFKEKFAGGSNRGSLVPVPGLDSEGNFIYLQPRADGSMGEFRPPEGMRPLSPYQKSFETSSGGEAGKLTATAEQQYRMAAPGITDAAEKAKELLTVDADKDGEPDYKSQVGPLDSWKPTISGTGRAWQARLNQLKGKAFLAARQELKGGGAITDFESTKAEEALIRADTAQSEQEFELAVSDFINALEVGRQKLAAAANIPSQAQQGQQGQSQPVSIGGYTIQQVD